MKERIDIEDVLVWAYRTQAVMSGVAQIRQALGARGPANLRGGPLGTFATLGVPIDGGRSGYGGFELARSSGVADDALTLHDLVLALPAILVEWPGDGCFALHWVDRLGMAGISQGLDGGYMRAGEAIEVTSLEPTVLIIQHAKVAARPDTMPDFVADYSERPRDHAGRWIRDRDAYRRTLDDVMHMRAGYAAWREGLARLEEEIRSGQMLDRYEVTGPEADPAPWLGVGEPVNRAGSVVVNPLS